MATLFCNFVRVRKNYIPRVSSLLKFRKRSAAVSSSCRLDNRKNVVRAVASQLSESVDFNRGESNRQQRKFPYKVISVLGIMTANNEEEEEDSSATHDVSQDQTVTPFSSHHGKRNANGRFAKAATRNKSLVQMREGYKTYTAKRKLEFENDTDENEPPSRRRTRSTEVCLMTHYHFGKVLFA